MSFQKILNSIEDKRIDLNSLEVTLNNIEENGMEILSLNYEEFKRQALEIRKVERSDITDIISSKLEEIIEEKTGIDFNIHPSNYSANVDRYFVFERGVDTLPGTRNVITKIDLTNKTYTVPKDNFDIVSQTKELKEEVKLRKRKADLFKDMKKRPLKYIGKMSSEIKKNNYAIANEVKYPTSLKQFIKDFFMIKVFRRRFFYKRIDDVIIYQLEKREEALDMIKRLNNEYNQHIKRFERNKTFNNKISSALISLGFSEGSDRL